MVADASFRRAVREVHADDMALDARGSEERKQAGEERRDAMAIR
jgi:hypothetical protein